MCTSMTRTLIVCLFSYCDHYIVLIKNYLLITEALDKAINEHDSSTSDSVTGSVDSVQRMPDLLDTTRYRIVHCSAQDQPKSLRYPLVLNWRPDQVWKGCCQTNIQLSRAPGSKRVACSALRVTLTHVGSCKNNLRQTRVSI